MRSKIVGWTVVALFMFVLILMIRHVALVKLPDNSISLVDLGSKYVVLEIHDFLTHAECDAIIEKALTKGLNKSTVFGSESDIEDMSTRKSDQTWLRDEEHEIVSKISQKVAWLTGLPRENQESMQVARYHDGGKFNAHYDPCILSDKECKRMNGDSGPRVFTVLIYLTDDFQGGDTYFPRLDIRVRPRKGKAVLFQNTRSDGKFDIIDESEHGGEVVTEGEKWICNKWVHARAYVG